MQVSMHSRPLPHDAAPSAYQSAKRPTPGPPVSVGVSSAGPATLQMSHPAVAAHHAAVMASFDLVSRDPYHLLNPRNMYGLGLPATSTNQVPVSAPSGSPFHHPLHHSITGGAPPGPPGASSGPPPGLSLHPATLNQLFIGPPSSHNGMVPTQRELVSHHLMSSRVAPSNMRAFPQEMLAHEMAARNEQRMKLLDAHQPTEHLFSGRMMPGMVPSSTPSSLSNSVPSSLASSVGTNNTRRRPSMLPPNSTPLSADAFSHALINNSMSVVSVPSCLSSIPSVVSSSREKFDIRLPPIYSDSSRIKSSHSTSSSLPQPSSSVSAPIVFPPAPSSVHQPPPNSAGIQLLAGSLPPGLLHTSHPSSGSSQGPHPSSHHSNNPTLPSHHPSPNHLVNEIYKRQKTNHSYGPMVEVPSSTILNISASGPNESSSKPTNQELSIDTQDNGDDGYNPHFEAISPTPNDELRYSPLQLMKDRLLEDIRQVEGDINSVSGQIRVLEMKQIELQKMTIQPPNESESQSTETREPLLVQKIYIENRQKAKLVREKLAATLGPNDPLPKYQYPFDLPTTHEIRKKYVTTFRVQLIERIRREKRKAKARQEEMVKTYERLMTEWQKKLEKKQQEKEYQTRQQKYREYFEKQFPELKKQREDRERLTRGQRIRSDVEMEELVDSLQWQELEERKNRHLAVIPPLLLNPEQHSHRYDNRNGLIEDPKALYLEMKNINLWTDGERVIFKEKYILTPKKFGMISSHLERKSIGDCVLYYYLSKKKEHYKQLLRKHAKKRTRALARAQAQTGHGAGTSNGLAEGLAVKHSNMADGLKCILPYSVAPNSGPVKIVIPPPNANGTRVLKSIEDCDREANASTSFFCDIVCSLCSDKVEHIGKSFPVNQSNAAQYGLTPEALRSGSSGRICARCHLKHVRQACPIPSCRTPKRKIKKMKLKLMPNGWFDMAQDQKQKLAEELDVPVDSKIGCLRCVAKVRRGIDKSDANEDESLSRWNESEVEKLRELIKQHGKDWNAIANGLGSDKNATHCLEMYRTNKRQHKLWQAYREYKVAVGKRKENTGGDSSEPTDDDDTSGSSNEEEKANNSDTASASSSIGERKVEEEVPLTSAGSSTANNTGPTLQDLKPLSASQGSLKSDYDSSATMSADESQPTESTFSRTSNHLDLGRMVPVPMSTVFNARDLITERTTHPPVPTFLINPNAPSVGPSSYNHPANQPMTTQLVMNSTLGPITSDRSPSKEEPTCVRDLIYKAIELSLKPTDAKGNPVLPPGAAQANHQDEQPSVTAAITTTTPTGFPLNLKRENPTPEPNKIENHNSRPQSTKPEGLASYYPAQANSVNSHFESSECEVQDLSKKDRRPESKTNEQAKGSAPVLPPAKSPFPAHPIGVMNSSFIQPAHSNQRTSLTDPYLHDPNKSRPPPQPSPFSGISQPALKLNKVSPKPPDMQQQHSNYRDKLTPTSSLAGSITQGTPVVLQPGQQNPAMAVKFGPPGTQFHPDIRFLHNENMLRQINPHLGSAPKGGPETAHGSITQGTPLVLGGTPNSIQMSNSNSKKNPVPEPKLLELMERMHQPRMSDNSMFRPFSPGMTPMTAKVARELGLSPQAHLAAAQAVVAQAAAAQAAAQANQQNQILIDYNTSKQMYQTPRRSSASSDKEHHESAARIADKSRNATSTPYQVSPAQSPSGIYLNERGQIVRAEDKLPPGIDPSLLAPWNSAALLGPGGPNAYSLNRANVIQGWNPGSKSVIQVPKSNSPREFSRELEMKNRVSPLVSGYPPSGQPSGVGDQEDFNLLVNAAAMQPSLSVPSSVAQAMSASRLAKDAKQGFEKALLEQNKQTANSNRIVFPGLPHHSVDELELLKKQAEEKAKAFKVADARPPSVDSLDFSKRFPNVFPPPVLNEHEKQQLMMLDQRKKIEMAALQFRPELIGNSALTTAFQQQLAQNAGLRFSREPFSSEHFERELRQSFERQVAVDEANKRKAAGGAPPTSGGVTLPTPADMDEASKLFSQSFQKDSAGSQTETLTAASLIHAIITSQINNSNSASLGNYTGNRHGKAGGNVSTPSPSATPPVTNSHPLMSNKQHTDKEMDGLNARDFTLTKSAPAIEPQVPRGSFRDTIFNVIKDNFNNNSNSQPPITPPPSSTPSRMPIMQSQTILEGIAAAAAASPGGSSADNFKLRRALQSEERAAKEEFPNKRLAAEGEIHLMPRQHVIHLPNTMANAVTGVASSSSSPLLTATVPNIKSISNYIEPISPPNQHPMAVISTAGPLNITTSASTVPTTAPGLPPGANWPHHPWAIPQHLSFMKPPGMGEVPPPPSTSATSAHFGDFGFSSRIAEAMQRANPASSSGGNSNAESEKKSESSGMTSKKNSEETSARATPNNVPATNNTNDTNNAYPDSPNSPGEMVIDENRDTSSPDPVKGADSGGGEKEGGTIITRHNDSKATLGSNSKHDGPQYEPLSDDDT